MPISQCSETVEAGDAVPFGVHDPLAVVVAQHATFREAGGEVARLKLVMLVPP